MFLKRGSSVLLNVDTIRSIDVHIAGDGSGKGVVVIQYAGGNDFTMRFESMEKADSQFERIVEIISNTHPIVEI